MIDKIAPGDSICWNSPLFGLVGPGVALEASEHSVLVFHPLTQLPGRIDREWVTQAEKMAEKEDEWELK